MSGYVYRGKARLAPTPRGKGTHQVCGDKRGTITGYDRHVTQNLEKPCPECREFTATLTCSTCSRPRGRYDDRGSGPCGYRSDRDHRRQPGQVGAMSCHCCPWCDQPHDCSPDCNRPDCPACEDRGEIDTGRTEPETGMPVTAPCPYCTPGEPA